MLEYDRAEKYIKLKDSNLHIAIFDNKELRLVENLVPKINFEYYDRATLKNENENIDIKFGNKHICNKSSYSDVLICDEIPDKGKGVKLLQMDDCIFLINHDQMCVTKGTFVEDSVKSELEELNLLDVSKGGSKYFELLFSSCEEKEKQCFELKDIDQESNESIETKKKDIQNNEKQEKASNKLSSSKTNKNHRKYEKIKDYDMRYVNEALDEAHHFLAQEDPEALLSRKHYAPDCFYGYNSINMFFNDPLPNLRKMKQKYCFFNKSDILRN